MVPAEYLGNKAPHHAAFDDQSPPNFLPRLINGHSPDVSSDVGGWNPALLRDRPDDALDHKNHSRVGLCSVWSSHAHAA